MSISLEVSNNKKMTIEDVDDGSLIAHSQFNAGGLVWASAAILRGANVRHDYGHWSQHHQHWHL